MALKGQRIRHHSYGPGTIVESRNSGFLLHVRFDSGRTAWINGNTVALDRAKTARSEVEPKRPDAQTSGKPRVEEARFRARRLVEALRLGIVPEDWVADFTFGREGEVAAQLLVTKQMARGDPKYSSDLVAQFL